MITFLHIQTWIGLSPEACHYNGKLEARSNPSVELKRILSESDATKLNKIRRRQYPGEKLFAHFRAGIEYDGFDSRDDLIKLALKTYKAHFPDSNILILGRASVCDPQLILDHPDQALMVSANKLYEKFESYEDYSFKENWPIVEPIAAEWERLLK